jgi:predicted MFS family arabinose efflux permease
VGGRLTAAAFFAVMLGATMPTPLYPLYEQRFGFGGLTVTVVFATYAVGVVGALLLAGGLSNDVGRRPILFAGLGLAAASSAVFLIDSVPALFVGRVLSGLSAGVFTGVATTTIVELAAPSRRARAGLLAAVVNILGLGFGPIVAGALAEYAPAPLALPYLVHIGLVILGVVAVVFVPEPVAQRRSPRWHVQAVGVPVEVRPTFVRAATAGFAGFGVLGLFASISPLFVGQVLHVSNHLAGGALLFALLGSSAVGQVLTAALPERLALPGGCLALAVGAAVVGIGVGTASLGLVVTGAIVAGLGQGASFRAGLVAVTAPVAAELRSAVSSSYFFVLYVAISIPVIGVGVGTAVLGLVPAAVGFTGLVALLALGAFVSLLRRR